MIFLNSICNSLDSIAKSLEKPDYIGLLSIIVSIVSIFFAAFLTNHLEKKSTSDLRKSKLREQVYLHTNSELKNVESLTLNSLNNMSAFYNLHNFIYRFVSSHETLTENLIDEFENLKISLIFDMTENKSILRKNIQTLTQVQSLYSHDHTAYKHLQELISFLQHNLSIADKKIMKLTLLDLARIDDIDNVKDLFMYFKNSKYPFDDDKFSDNWNKLLEITQMEKLKP